MYNREYRSRLYLVFIAFLSVFILLSVRILYLQGLRSGYFKRLASKQHDATIELKPQRGTIFDRNMHALATSIDLYSVYAESKMIQNKQKVAKDISDVLGIEEQAILEKLKKDKMFVWIARKVPPDKTQRLKSLKLKNVGFVKESKRFYPQGVFASQVIGFADVDNVGLEGLEKVFDNYLKGQSGYRNIQRDAKRRSLAFTESQFVAPVDGSSLVLTIDEVIQYIVEKEIDEVYKKYRAKGATIVVMDPRNGEILAMANRPTFDLNNFRHSSNQERRNRAVTDFFEPGSTFKIVTASAALDTSSVKLDDKFYCENGKYFHAGHTLHDYHPYGWLTFREVIQNSSNIGVCKIAQILGPQIIYRYMRLFGFGQKTGIQLPGEVGGIAKHPGRWSKVSITNIPMGQEVTVTALQLACAISAVANGGSLVKPTIIKLILDENGKVIKKYEPKITRQAISRGTSLRMKQILKQVIENGTGTMAKIEEYDAAGKTGTSQKVDPKGFYSQTDFMASFIGFAPVEDPVISVVVVIDEPRPYHFGGVVAAPVFKKITQNSLRYLNVTPNKEALAKKNVR